jgi:bifunctional non-homologous end joining protein LigD
VASQQGKSHRPGISQKTSTKKQSDRSTKSSDSSHPQLSLTEFLNLKKPAGDVTVEVDGFAVALTSLDRVYWPKEKITKFDLLCYYIEIHEHILPFLENRPAILQRHPRGIEAPMFFQHDLENAPKYLKRKRMKNEEGREIEYAVYTNLASLLYLVNLGTIEQHPWNSTIQRLQRPDWIVIDLDPKDAPWKNVLAVALVARELFNDRGLKAFVKTSGSSGMHLYLPLLPKYSYQAAAKFAAELASEIAARAPKLATIERTISERQKQQVYVDWLQNARGKSVAAPFTARAKPKAAISMPLHWIQVENGVKITDFTIKNGPEWISKQGDPWADFFNSRQSLAI